MRVLLMLSVAVVLGLGTSLRADDSDGKRPSREEMKKQFMAKYDKNKDGKICDEEKKAIRAEWAKHAHGHHHAHDAKAGEKKECPDKKAASAKKERPKKEKKARPKKEKKSKKEK